MKFKNIETITNAFIKNGWGKGTTFTEISLEEAEKEGQTFAVNGIKKGRKYFRMGISGNIYDDNGEIAAYNI